MVLKCYNKPNRTRPRYFTVCDAARIARQVNQDRGDTPEMIIACIAKGFGFTHISLSRTTAVQSAVNISKSVALIRTLIQGLQAIASKLDFKWLIAKLSAILDALDVIEKAVDALTNEPDQAKVEDVLPEGYCECEKKRG